MENFTGDEIIDRLLRKHLSAQNVSIPQCAGFDPDLAAAYIEQALTPPEQQHYEHHLSDCASCRKMLQELFQFTFSTTTAKETPPVAQVRSRLSFEWLRSWLFGPQLRWALPILLVGLLISSIWLITKDQAPTLTPTNNKTINEPPLAQSTPNKQSEPSPNAIINTPEASPKSSDNQPVAKPAAKNLAPSHQPYATIENKPDNTVAAAPEVNKAARDKETEKSAGAALDLPKPAQTERAFLPHRESEYQLSGSVTDSRGFLVAGAQVILRDTLTGTQQYTNADESGKFIFSALPTGNYLVEAQTETQRKAQTVRIGEGDVDLKLQFDTPMKIAIADSVKQQEQEERKSPSQRRLDASEPSPSTAKPSSDQAKAEGNASPARKDKATEKSAGAAKPAKTLDASSVKKPTPRAETVPEQRDMRRSRASREQKIGNKVFLLINEVWIDQEYLLQEEQGKKFVTIRVKHESEQYQQLLKENPALQAYFKLGSRVAVLYENKVYIVTEK
ncbi:MAG: carboxypeptidase regulatory-like domain-containing protein [Acidobacteriota bacterium]